MSEKDQEIKQAAEAVAPEAPAKEAKPAEAAPEASAAPVSEPEAEASTEQPEASAEPPAEAVEAAPAKPKRPKASKKRGRPRKPIGEIEVGLKTRGKVVGMAKFGAFVDIGSMTDGLVHISELPGNKRIAKVEDVLKPGDEVEVWVKEVDVSKNRISLSMKTKPSNPLAEISAGSVVSGSVSSVAKYGCFVDIGSETEGLVHISEMSSGFVERPEDIVKPGDTIEVRVKEIDRQRERISLSMVGLANDAGQSEAQAKAAEEAEYVMPDEPEERMPTVLEMALRGAGLIESDEGDAEADTEVGDAEGATDGSERMTGVYSQMLDEYREAKAADER